MCRRVRQTDYTVSRKSGRIEFMGWVALLEVSQSQRAAKGVVAIFVRVHEEALSGPLGCRTTPPAAVAEAGVIGVTGLPTILLSRLRVEVGRLLAVFGILSRSTEPEPKMIERRSELLLLLLAGAEMGAGAVIGPFEKPFCMRFEGSAGTGGMLLFSPGAAVCMNIDLRLLAEAATARKS